MTSTAFGHALETLRDGVTGFVGREPRPVPLASTRIDVEIRAGLAVMTTTRVFRNAEDIAIEAILTFPVGFDAVVTGLSARIDGRELKAIAKAKNAARATYEDAIDRGKTAILHEEVLRGLHVLSVANLAPGKEVAVTVECVAPLADVDGAPLLRIPTTVGQVYGTSPLMPADDLVTDPNVRHEAELMVRAETGRPRFVAGAEIAGPVRLLLNRAIEIVVPGHVFGTVGAGDGTGQRVEITTALAKWSKQDLRLAIVVDRSGSMDSNVGRRRDRREISTFEAVRQGLAAAGEQLTEADGITLFEFDDVCDNLGSGYGRDLARLASRLSRPQGGTELGVAVAAVARSGATDILVITDGQTHATEISEAATRGRRISTVLVGEGSLDAGVGHLAAMTGGQVFYAPGEDVGAAITVALASFRRSGSAVAGQMAHGLPSLAICERGGLELTVRWNEGAACEPDAVGRFAAALALPLVTDPAEAARYAAAQGLCSHLTSLVLVDEAGEVVDGLPEMRKVSLMEVQACMFDILPCSPDLAPMTSMNESISPMARSSTRLLMASPMRVGPSAGIKLIDWSSVGNAVLAGDLSGLPEHIQRWIVRLAERDDVKDLASTLNKPVLAVAAALFAERQTDRHAQRIARAVLENAPEAKLVAARATHSDW